MNEFGRNLSDIMVESVQDIYVMRCIEAFTVICLVQRDRNNERDAEKKKTTV